MNEMGDGDSDGEYFGTNASPTPAQTNVCSPSRIKVTYDYKFDSSSDEEVQVKVKHPTKKKARPHVVPDEPNPQQTAEISQKQIPAFLADLIINPSAVPATAPMPSVQAAAPVCYPNTQMGYPNMNPNMNVNYPGGNYNMIGMQPNPAMGMTPMSGGNMGMPGAGMPNMVNMNQMNNNPAPMGWQGYAVPSTGIQNNMGMPMSNAMGMGNMGQPMPNAMALGNMGQPMPNTMALGNMGQAMPNAMGMGNMCQGVPNSMGPGNMGQAIPNMGPGNMGQAMPNIMGPGNMGQAMPNAMGHVNTGPVMPNSMGPGNMCQPMGPVNMGQSMPHVMGPNNMSQVMPNMPPMGGMGNMPNQNMMNHNMQGHMGPNMPNSMKPNMLMNRNMGPRPMKPHMGQPMMGPMRGYPRHRMLGPRYRPPMPFHRPFHPFAKRYAPDYGSTISRQPQLKKISKVLKKENDIIDDKAIISKAPVLNIQTESKTSPQTVKATRFSPVEPKLSKEGPSSESNSKTDTHAFRNDGSFLEVFKKIKETEVIATPQSTDSKKESVPEKKPKPMPSMVGKRRGGRVLKTGMVEKVKKPKPEDDDEPKDAWSLYMSEVKKYREANCEEERKTRALMPVAAMAVKIDPANFELSTAPFDPRFPNTNQTKYCYTSFLDYHRCQKARGTDYEPCNYFKRVFRSMCPNAWVDKWNTQLEEGTFPGRI